MSAGEQAVLRALFEELDKLASACGTSLVELEALAGADALVKQAVVGAIMKRLAGPARPFSGGPGLFQRFGADLVAGGQMLGAPTLAGPGRFQAPGLGRRVASEVAQSTGRHYAHKSTLGHLLNPLGGAVGGVSEGLTRSMGSEALRSGRALGGRSGGLLERAGQGLTRAAGGVGRVGEVAGLAGLGVAAGAPLSVQGLLGGKMMAAAVPGAEAALHHAGEYLHHAAGDAVGTASQGIARRARRALGALGRAGMGGAG
jgi:hypothetical protein